MRLLEYQAKRLFAEAGIPVPDGTTADTPEQAESVAHELGGPLMIKAHVRAGGRGKAGGVLRAASPAQARQAAAQLLGSPLAGLPVRRVLVERALDIERELYLAVTVDYELGRAVVLVGSHGGVEAETQAERAGSLARAGINPLVGLPDYLGRDLLRWAGLDPQLLPSPWPLARALYRLFVERDALLAEINPLALTPAGRLVAVDARLSVDDAALRRQPELARLAEENPDESLEERIKREYDFDLVVVDPEGDVGLISTGAGGTMMTVDLIQRTGGRPFNFADVRTGRLLGDPTRLIVVLRELAARPSVRAVLVSVFGAITDLEEFARTLCQALDAVPLAVPIQVRVQGYKAEEAKAILRECGLPCYDGLETAVEATVASVGAGLAPPEAVYAASEHLSHNPRSP